MKSLTALRFLLFLFACLQSQTAPSIAEAPSAEVISAQANALQSKLDLTTVTRDQLDAKAELYRSLGGGWN